MIDQLEYRTEVLDFILDTVRSGRAITGRGRPDVQNNGFDILLEVENRTDVGINFYQDMEVVYDFKWRN